MATKNQKATLSQLFGRSLVVMDGGLGTTLEEELGLEVTQSAVWSAHPIANNSEAIVKAHLAFLRAGAQIILTSTYQCSFESFSRAGFDAQQAKNLMLESVRLADIARTRFQVESSKESSRVHIALSLGPLGATLKPTQEFGGFYPPPYGPRNFIPGDSSNQNSFGLDDAEREIIAVEALARFHFDRLVVFADDTDVWQSIDCIAFETVPLRREVKAIRKAMGRLKNRLEKGRNRLNLKPWWISCVFSSGASPEDKFPEGPKVKIEEIVEVALKEDEDMSILRPSGFGINCTAVEYTQDLSTRLGDLMKKFEGNSNGDRPWLILYPNGGGVYDEGTQTWQGLQDGKHKDWAEELGVIILGLSEKAFGGIIVGGCCKTGPKEIAALARYLDMHNGT